MALEDELEFDEEGFHHFVESEQVLDPAEGYKFVSSAYVTEEDFKDRVLYVEFKDGYLADFVSEEVIEELDRHLEEVEGVEGVYWEDRELFQVTYKEGQDIKELTKRIDTKVDEISKLEDE